MPWAATRVAPTISDGPSWILEGLDRRVAIGQRVDAQKMQRSRKPSEHGLLYLDVACEHDKRLAGGEEVLDPRQRGCELPASGQALERPELGQSLGTQGCRDPRVQLGQVERLRAQPLDHVVLGQAIFGLVGQRDGHHDLALGRQLGEHVGFQAANETAAGVDASASRSSLS